MYASFKKQVNQLGNQVVNFLLPPLCPATGEMVDKQGMVDAAFWQQLNFIHAPFCERCGIPFSFAASHLECGACMEHPPLYTKGRAALFYDDASRHLILRFKHGDRTFAVKSFIPWLRMAGSEILPSADVILPVPLHPFRLIRRRYNQAELMARELSRYYPQAAYYPDGLKRTRHTQIQGFKNARERSRNVRKAFTVNRRYDFTGKTVLIIDDVYTTGATINECAQTLLNAGAKEVNCLALAKVVRP